MDKSLDQIFAEAADGDSVGVVVVSNQADGIASYATGRLIHYAQTSSANPPLLRSARLSTTGGAPLQYYFSDRLLDIDPPSPPGSLGHSPRQPFSANATDELGLSISRNRFGPPVAKLTLHSWGNASFSVPMESKGSLLVGIGPPVGGQTDHALYVIAFTGISHPPR